MADEEDIMEGEEPESGLFRWMSALVVLLAVAGFFGLAWYAYKNGGEAVDDKDVELVKADKTPVKEAPANPGGMQIPNQDKTVYGLISGKTEKPVVERILPAPEEPIARSGDTETWMSDSVKSKAQGADEDAKPQADGDTAATPAPKTDTPKADTQKTDVQKTDTDSSTASAKPKEQFNPAKARAALEAQTKDAAPVQPVTVAQAQPLTPAPTVHADPSANTENAAPAPAPEKPAPPAPVKATPALAKPVADAKAQPPKQQDDSDDSADDEDAKPATKPEAKTETTAAPAPSAKPPAGARVQLGAYKSQSEAESNWGRISRKFADDLQGKQHYTVRVDLGAKGVYYRLQLAPFSSSRDAEQFCLDFVSAGQGCILARGK